MPRVVALLASLLLSTVAAAQAAPADATVPPSLRDWTPWALKGLEYRSCPFLAASGADSADDFVCAWPGPLTLASSADGATFSIRWRVEAPSWIMLPGDAAHWPQQVTVDQRREPVLLHGERPSLWLPPGAHTISGRIPWSERPQSLAVPPGIGLVALTVDGRAVVPVQRDGDEVTLGRTTLAAPVADSIELRVYRKLADGVPATLTTNIVMGVSGQAREVVVGPALPAGFVPQALTSEWPARLDRDHRLHVQVQPGVETVVLVARATAPLSAATARLADSPWPKQEIWSYEAAPRLRVTVASGALAIDPRQAEVPDEWQSLPTFALADGAKLAIEERSRGLAPDESNRLTLQREAWLDFSGDAWYARDRLSGSMATGWRFDVAAPYALEQATALNATGRSGGEPLLVTRGANAELTGVEWRTPRVDLAAGVRIAAPASMPVAGWRQTFDAVQATLHFPFGYKLLAAPGADSAAGSWAAGWTLLDVFVCAIAALLAWRLLGPGGVLAAALFLLLGHNEPGAPLWTLVAALALALVARALPQGRLARWAEGLRRAALLLLVLVALPFLADELRFALYPQLEGGGYGASAPGSIVYRQKTAGGVALNAPAYDEVRSNDAAPAPMQEAELATPMSPPPPPQPLAAGRADKRELKDAAKAPLETVVVTGTRIERSQLIEHYAQTTVVQTGGGTPAWTLGSTAWLSWSGPVLATQDVRLLIAPPWLVRPLRVVLVALLAWLVWRVFRAGGGLNARRGAVSGSATTLLVAGLALAPVAHAQGYPSPELLQQLRQRLSEAPKCAPACASIADAQVTAAGDAVTVVLEAHAGQRVALPLPGDAAAAAVVSVRVDGIVDDALARDADGRLWLAVDRGVHRVEIAFSAPGDKVALAFPLPPGRVHLERKGWDASGIADGRLLAGTLTLARARDNAGAAAAGSAGEQQFPPYVRVRRNLSLGLEWTAATVVERVAPAQGGFSVEVPLIAGEHVSTAGVKVEDGRVQAAVGADDSTFNWNATLDKGDTIALAAPDLADRAETWSVVVSPTWHVDFSGVPVVGVANPEDANDYRNFEFHPLPGEKLTLHITRPTPAQGSARAIDAVALTSEVGQRATTHTLALTLRASQGGEQVIALPKDAEVLAVSRDGVALNLRPIDGRLSLPVAPGAQRYDVRLRSAEGEALRATTPSIALGLPAANVALSLQLPADRWLIATWGPPVGPAVLYWGELVVTILLAWVLARTRRTPLRFRDWLLLGLGFSTFSWAAWLAVVAWLFAFDWRGRAVLPQRRWAFNLLQAALALLTLVALVSLASAIPQGLLGQPDMHVTGNGSWGNSLHWFADRSADALPQASAISVPLWVYKLLMLAWALWLANALIGWLRAAFAAWTRDGYWRPKSPATAAAPTAPEPAPVEAQ